MRSRKANILSKVHKIPKLKFEDQKLSSYSGLIIFQKLFLSIELKATLKKCFSHLQVNSFYGLHNISLMLIYHLLMGLKRIRSRDLYFDDPIVKRVTGLRSIPDVGTISRSLSLIDDFAISKMRESNQDLVLKRVESELLSTVTLDFDGFVVCTQGKVEDSAAGYNKKKKGARSYYPLGCTLAQTGQMLDLLHRPGNVHDSNGAQDFIVSNVRKLKSRVPGVRVETRVDSAFFSDDLVFTLDDEKVEFSVSAPFARFTELKRLVENRKRWKPIDLTWSYFELDWAPKSWPSSFRLVIYRKKQAKQEKGPLQLDLFTPIEHEFQYKAVMTNKSCCSKKLLHFHNGRGSQEGIYAEIKTFASLDYLPFKRKCSNIVYSLCGVMAHNLSRELQMRVKGKERNCTEKRSPLWKFESLGKIQSEVINRAGRLTRPMGELTLTLNRNQNTKDLYEKFLKAI